MAFWVGGAPGAPTQPAADEAFGPFDGVLIVMNIGRDNYRNLDMPKAYSEAVQDAVKQAHADGWAVIYAFDSKCGIDQPPDDWDFLPGHTHYRLMNDVCGRRFADFSLLPTPRMDEFRAMFEHLKLHKAFNFQGNGQLLIGSCRIDQLPVLLPLTVVI